MIKIATFVLVSMCAAYAFHAFAQGRFDARPTVVTIASSSSNGISFAWLYDATDRTVYVCRAAAVAEPPDCKAKTLP